MCGIWGYSGKNFNKYKFNILGLFNDSRGGDSCGVFIGNKKKKQLGYGFDKTKLYSEFIASGVEIDFNEVNFALGHCRKASVGGIGAAQAQPVVIKDANGNIEFVMIHNGTLCNYRALAERYKVEYNYMETDSQIFAKVVYKVGYGVLGEYEGAGAFIFWDKRDGDNTIKVFKGASLYYEHDETLYIERPLFCMKNKSSFWISSMENSLNFINDENYEIEDLKCNILYTIMGGRIVGEDFVDRSKMRSVIPLAYNRNYKPALPFHNNKDFNYNGEDWDSYSEADWQKLRSKNFKELTKSVNNNYNDTNILETFKTDRVINPNIHVGFYKKKIIFGEDGLYSIGGEPCHGIILATQAGFTDGSVDLMDEYYFVCGVMMKSYFDYLTALEYCQLNFSPEDEPYPVFLAKWSTTPVPVEWENAQTGEHGVWFNIFDEVQDAIDFTGTFSPYFSYTREIYTVVAGEITNYVKLSTKHKYEQDLVSIELDNKILGKQISDEELQKLIEENL